MYNVDSGIVRVEVSGYENIGGGLRRKSSKYFGVRSGFLLAKKECGARAVFVFMVGLVSL